VGSPQNVEAVRQSFIRSPRHSARRYSVALGISDHSMRRILHNDPNFHLYKMVVVQELSDRDMANHSKVVEHLIKNLSDDVIILTTDEAHRIFAIEQRKIHSSSINSLFTVHM
jgi:Asp-tRNA(Asn)/Glu-tRNA(Gln) amidotransferase B subunit